MLVTLEGCGVATNSRDHVLHRGSVQEESGGMFRLVNSTQEIRTADESNHRTLKEEDTMKSHSEGRTNCRQEFKNLFIVRTYVPV